MKISLGVRRWAGEEKRYICGLAFVRGVGSGTFVRLAVADVFLPSAAMVRTRNWLLCCLHWPEQAVGGSMESGLNEDLDTCGEPRTRRRVHQRRRKRKPTSGLLADEYQRSTLLARHTALSILTGPRIQIAERRPNPCFPETNMSVGPPGSRLRPGRQNPRDPECDRKLPPRRF